METTNTVLTDLANLASDLLSNVFFYGLFGAIFGLILGIFIVRKCSKKGLFNRSNGLWSFLVKLNYVLLPLALLLVGLTQGGIYGAHDTAGQWIKQTTDPIIDYAEGYLPELQSFCNTHLHDRGAKHASVEDIVKAQSAHQSSGMKKQVVTSFNTFLVGGFLDVTTGRGDVAEPLVILSQIDTKNLDRNVFELVPASMRSVCSFYFAAVYWTFFAPFGTYFLIVIGEALFFRMISKGNKTADLDDEYVPELGLYV